MHHKAAKSAKKKSLLLPVVVSPEGVGSQPWLEWWVRNRKKCGLPVSGLVDGPLIPVPTSGWQPFGVE